MIVHIKRGQMKDKNKVILEYVISWLNSNIDDAMNKFDPVASDSADLKEKIELAMSSENTAQDIDNGNF
tara:strand:+ start:27 stop:233 length:207 start_codon:yes stop_codon:yes gene_type:complete